MVAASADGPSPLANALGTVGGLLLSVCLVPQLVQVWRTRSAKDLSYAWTVLYGGGLAFMGAYLVLARAAVGAAFNFVELGLVALTLGAKLYLEQWVPRRAGAKPGAAAAGSAGGEPEVEADRPRGPTPA